MIYGLLMFLLIAIGIFMILLVLIQRGKGGGLAGAFGGMGGQSAFGTKAGDLFTRITIGVAAVWIVLCVVTIKYLTIGTEVLDPNLLGKSKVAERPDLPDVKGAGATGTAKEDGAKKEPVKDAVKEGTTPATGGAKSTEGAASGETTTPVKAEAPVSPAPKTTPEGKTEK